MKKIRYSMGCGDRFGREGKAQLKAFKAAGKLGIEIFPVWNKSHREHTTVHTEPASVRGEADDAVNTLGWSLPYYVDADHISLKTVDGFIEYSNFFTLDVADSIGKAAATGCVESFIESMLCFVGKEVLLPGTAETLRIKETDIRSSALNYLFAIQEAGKIYRHIAARKTDGFEVEVSMDERSAPQTPLDLFFILAMVAAEQIPIDTIAPKFSGRFNKGVDYVGDVDAFEKEFELDVATLKWAAQTFGLKEDLRLSVHSGSDKFSIYPAIKRVIKKHGAGLHVKTAGTTWLEEVIGLAEAGGDGLDAARKIYAGAFSRYDELVAPYATVIDIDPEKLPTAEAVMGWSSDQFVNALRHEPYCPEYNVNFRQLIHVAYKVAYELGDEYFQALDKHGPVVARNVTHNLLNRHILPIFG